MNVGSWGWKAKNGWALLSEAAPGYSVSQIPKDVVEFVIKL